MEMDMDRSPLVSDSPCLEHTALRGRPPRVGSCYAYSCQGQVEEDEAATARGSNSNEASPEAGDQADEVSVDTHNTEVGDTEHKY
jgi:hypothetical protein